MCHMFEIKCICHGLWPRLLRLQCLIEALIANAWGIYLFTMIINLRNDTWFESNFHRTDFGGSAKRNMRKHQKCIYDLWELRFLMNFFEFYHYLTYTHTTASNTSEYYKNTRILENGRNECFETKAKWKCVSASVCQENACVCMGFYDFVASK